MSHKRVTTLSVHNLTAVVVFKCYARRGSRRCVIGVESTNPPGRTREATIHEDITQSESMYHGGKYDYQNNF